MYSIVLRCCSIRVVESFKSILVTNRVTASSRALSFLSQSSSFEAPYFKIGQIEARFIKEVSSSFEAPYFKIGQLEGTTLQRVTSSERSLGRAVAIVLTIIGKNLFLDRLKVLFEKRL